MLDWKQLVFESDEQLATRDIAEVNLACAAGLPGSVKIDYDLCRRKLDEWTRYCGWFTERAMPYFRAGKYEEYPNSEPRFRIHALITALQRDCGVRYHPDKKNDDAKFEPEDSFLYGILQGGGGTCASLPVLYVSIGRRLGYPLKLVEAKHHLYARWDAPMIGERFNIEGSGEGVSFFPDEHYRTGRFAMPPQEIHALGFSLSLTPRAELAAFVRERGECWMQEKVYRAASFSFAWANDICSKRQDHLFLAWQAARCWDQQLRARLPSKYFPKLNIGLPPPAFKEMPRDLEKELIRMQIMEDLLNNREFERLWWGPMRRNPHVRPPGAPAVLRIDHGRF